MSDGHQQGRTSFAQQGIWLNERTRDMHDAYHAPCLITFDGELDTGALRTACAAVLARHPVLTSAFEEDGGVPWMRPADRVPELEIDDPGEGDPEARLAELVRRHAPAPFDFERGPLVRLVLAPLGPGRHALLLVTHHLVFDGPSLDLFTRDLAACYRAAVSGAGPEAPAASFAGYAAGEERRIAAALPTARRFWRERWQEPDQMALPGVTGPIGYAAPAHTIRFTIGAERRDALGRAGEALGVTRFELLLASMYALLYRYGNADPVITVALGLRPEEFADAIGPFAQELPVAARVGGDLTFRELAAAVHEHLGGLSPHRGVPLNRAVTGVRPAAMRTAVSISYRRSSPAHTLPGLRIRGERLPNQSARGAFWVLVFNEDDGMRFIINHPEERFPAESAERVAGHWRELLDQAVAAPDTRVGALTFLGDSERGLLLAANPGEPAGAAERTVVDLFAERVAADRGGVAVLRGTAETTGERLDAATEGLARRLRCAGVTPGSLVAIETGDPADALTGMLAVLRAGAAYLLAGPDGPTVRSGVSAVLSAAAGTGGPPVLAFDADGCVCGNCGADALADPAPEDVAYAALSPTPDGPSRIVRFDHRALTGALLAFRAILEFGPGGTFLALSRVTAPGAALELLLPATAGGRVVVPAPEEADEPARLVALVGRHAITHAQATPSLWQLLLDAGLDAPGLTALSGGETLQPTLARRLRARLRRLWNVHGTDDAALWSTCGEVAPGAETVAIGRPVPGARVHLLDASGALVPIGSPGELCVAGPALARDDDGRFAPDPFGSGGSRLARTGKRARWRPDGELDFLGGDHRRIRLNGQEVELADVEARLGAHDAVARCAVTTAEDGGLLAYLLPAGDEPPAEEELGGWLAATLPEGTAVGYVTLPEFPLTPDRRLDVGRLSPEAGRARRPAVTRSAGVREEDLETVAKIWRDVLRAGEVGLDDNLFDFGVNSLIVTQISARIFRRTGVDIPLETFYEAPTINEICGVIAQARREE
ncbi:condensation domain-containing protein [Actinomadura sp. DC4]|uniref:condensation domain-containing protein n=1 Tax=Actinomadura sp. DC4 TaxID=3055069 RepID=UPI0025AFAC64|nr:condensation domain-containing protein [Actinomadura sp. DC4]MDN3358468.1 condensation domain-containing protein [Actinomadura sp. DC4]